MHQELRRGAKRLMDPKKKKIDNLICPIDVEEEERVTRVSTRTKLELGNLADKLNEEEESVKYRLNIRNKLAWILWKDLVLFYMCWQGQ